MNNRKGFTLTELLVVIGMIAVLGTIIIYSTIGINNSSKDLQYERMLESIKNATKTYVSLYPEEFSDLFSSRAFTYVSLNAVKEAGLIDEEVINPYTNKPLDFNQSCAKTDLESSGKDCLSKVKVYVDGDSYEMMYTYPVTADDIGTQRWLQYNTAESYEEEGKGFSYVYAYSGLEQGDNNTLASTAFALVEESGSLIQKPTGYTSYYKYITANSTFHMTYQMPDSFVKCTATSEVEACKQARTKIPLDSSIEDFYYPTQTGTFEITYNWSYTINGVTYNRSNKRKVRVMSATESEKEKLSSNARTTTRETTTANANGVLAEFYNQNLNGNTKVDTGVHLIEENNSFTVFIEGTITKHEDNKCLIDAYDSSNGSGFRAYLATKDISGRTALILRFQSYKGVSLSYQTVDFEYALNKKFRLVISRDVTGTANNFNVNFVRNLAEIPYYYQEKTVNLDRHRSSNKSLIIGGLRGNTNYLLGYMDKIVIFNKNLPDLINTGYEA